MKVPRDVDGLDDSMRSKFVGSWVWVLGWGRMEMPSFVKMPG